MRGPFDQRKENPSSWYKGCQAENRCRTRTPVTEVAKITFRFIECRSSMRSIFSFPVGTVERTGMFKNLFEDIIMIKPFSLLLVKKKVKNVHRSLIAKFWSRPEVYIFQVNCCLPVKHYQYFRICFKVDTTYWFGYLIDKNIPFIVISISFKRFFLKNCLAGY